MYVCMYVCMYICMHVCLCAGFNTLYVFHITTLAVCCIGTQYVESVLQMLPALVYCTHDTGTPPHYCILTPVQMLYPLLSVLAVVSNTRPFYCDAYALATLPPWRQHAAKLCECLWEAFIGLTSIQNCSSCYVPHSSLSTSIHNNA